MILMEDRIFGVFLSPPVRFEPFVVSTSTVLTHGILLDVCNT